jgi:hypothetical protein
VAHPKHQQVRSRYACRCGYCGVAEDEVGGELTIDHFVPVSAGGDETNANLIYACHRCNLYKGDFAASQQDQSLGHRVLHPQQDDPQRHFQFNALTGMLEPLTETGRFHIALLHLNRPALVALRLRKLRDSLRAARTELVAAENRELRAILKAQESYVASLRRLLQSPDVE